MSPELDIFIDGACSGNPGPAAVGIVIKKDGGILKEIALPIGEATNNIAEYTALILALQEAALLHVSRIKIFTDSELMFHQLTGTYKVRDERLKSLFAKARHLRKCFQEVDIARIPREQNKDADKLAAKALKKTAKKQAGMVAPLFDNSGEESPSSDG